MSIVSRFVSLVIAVSGKEWLLPTKHTFALWLLLFRLFFAAATTTFWASPAAALLLSVQCAIAISGGKKLPAPRTRGLRPFLLGSFFTGFAFESTTSTGFFAHPTAFLFVSYAMAISGGKKLPALRTRGLRPFLLGYFFAGGVFLAIAFFASPTVVYFVRCAMAISGGKMLPAPRTRGLRPFLLGYFFAGGVLAKAFWASPTVVYSVRCALAISGGKKLPAPRTRGLWASTSSAQISNEIIRIDDSVFDRATKHTFSVIG